MIAETKDDAIKFPSDALWTTKALDSETVAQYVAGLTTDERKVYETETCLSADKIKLARESSQSSDEWKKYRGVRWTLSDISKICGHDEYIAKAEDQSVMHRKLHGWNLDPKNAKDKKTLVRLQHGNDREEHGRADFVKQLARRIRSLTREALEAKRTTIHLPELDSSRQGHRSPDFAIPTHITLQNIDTLPQEEFLTCVVRGLYIDPLFPFFAGSNDGELYLWGKLRFAIVEVKCPGGDKKDQSKAEVYSLIPLGYHTQTQGNMYLVGVKYAFQITWTVSNMTVEVYTYNDAFIKREVLPKVARSFFTELLPGYASKKLKSTPTTTSMDTSSSSTSSGMPNLRASFELSFK